MNISFLFIPIKKPIGTKPKTYELFIGAFPQAGLGLILEEVVSALAPYHQALKEYETCHPRPEDRAAFLKWAEAIEHEVTPSFRQNLRDASGTLTLVKETKKGIYTHLASEVKGIAIAIRICEMMTELNYNIPRLFELIRTNPQKDDEEAVSMVQSIEGKLGGIGPAMRNDFGRAYALASILYNQFTNITLPAISTKYRAAPRSFCRGSFGGKINGASFSDMDNFIRLFNYFTSDQGENKGGLSFTLEGMFKSEFMLQRDSGLSFADFDYRSIAEYRHIFSPVHLKITVGGAANAVVEPIMKKIVDEYNLRLIPPSQLKRQAANGSWGSGIRPFEKTI